MILRAQIVHPTDRTDQRRSARREANARLTIEEAENGQDAQILNLSQTGLRVRSQAVFEVGSELTVEIPGHDRIQSKVVWREGDEFGCEFLTPISKAVMSAFILRSPTVRDIPLPTQGIREIELGEGYDVERIAKFVEEFGNHGESGTAKLVGFRFNEQGRIVAIVSDSI